MTRNATAVLTTGTRLAWDGEVWTVTGMEAGRLVLRSARGKSVLADTAAVLADPSTRLPGTGDEPGPAAFGPLLDSLTGAERGELAVRLGHVRELLTGYASGHPRRRSRASRGLGMTRHCRWLPGIRRSPLSWASASGPWSGGWPRCGTPARPGSPTAAASGAPTR